ncbi:MAG: hypothetical protein WDM91_11040 [Rhizomicrobium sp.]
MSLVQWVLAIIAADAQPPRRRLPDRRQSVVVDVTFTNHRGEKRLLAIGYSWDVDGRIRELFCPTGAQNGSDIDLIIHDGCIAISRALQFGDRIADLARSFTKEPMDTPEGTVLGQSSVFGAIALTGAEIEADLMGATP